MNDAARRINEPAQRLDRAAFRAWADAQPRGRFERHHGTVVAMSPERVAHLRLKARACRLLEDAVGAGSLPCEVFPDGLTIEIGNDHDFIPDAVVRCGQPLPPDATSASDPLILVEVLSPSTSATDRTTKLAAYFLLPSVQHYLIVWSDQRRVVHHRRAATGIMTSDHVQGTITLDPPGMSLDIAALYAEAGLGNLE